MPLKYWMKARSDRAFPLVVSALRNSGVIATSGRQLFSKRASYGRLQVLVVMLLVIVAVSACTNAQPSPTPDNSQSGVTTPPAHSGVAVASEPTPVASPSTSATAARPQQVADRFRRVFVIVMENRNFDDIIGSSDAPYINELAQKYGLATRYYGVTRPSLPNYLAMVSGSAHGIGNNCPDCTVDGTTIVESLEARGKSWKAYMENLPEPCFNGVSAGSSLETEEGVLYVRRHNPFMYFRSTAERPERCGRVVPLTEFEADLRQNALPDFVWVTPNLINDMHDGSRRQGDQWLSAFIPTILQSPGWRDNDVIFLVWDEGLDTAGCCGEPAGGHIPAVVIGENVKPGYRSTTPYNHYSLLRTIEEGWGLDYLGKSGDPDVKSMNEFFR